MPRPKRTKIAPSIPAARDEIPAARLKRTRDAVEDISDLEEGVVASARRFPKSRTRGVHNAGNSSQTVAQPTTTSDNDHGFALEGMKKRRDAAIARLEAENIDSSEQAVSVSRQSSSSPAVEFGRRAMATPTTENSLLAVGNFWRGTRQTSVLRHKDSRERSSSVESNLAESNSLSNFPVERSVQTRVNFRQRQRQPSILGRTASHMRSTSVGLETDRSTPGNAGSVVKAGLFKRRTRQPSILGTGKKDQRSREYGYDEDVFDPDDESTPLNLSKTRCNTKQGSQSVSPTTNPNKRKLSSLRAQSTSPRLPTHDSQLLDMYPSASSRQAHALEQPVRPSTPEPLSETMAPPRSSSSPIRDSIEVLLSSRPTSIKPSRQSGKRQAVRKPLISPREDSIPSSPPSLTHSPNRLVTLIGQRPTAARPQTHPANFSTIQLQALLPRRRYRQARDAYDIGSSDDGEIDLGDLGSDDDELTHAIIRTNRTTRSAAPRSVTRLKPGPRVKTKATLSVENTKASANKTYKARHAVSDKENDGDGFVDDDNADIDPDDSLAPIRDKSSPENSQELEERVGKELKTAKRKFEVVDKWELEFEDVTAGSSSPWDAR